VAGSAAIQRSVIARPQAAAIQPKEKAFHVLIHLDYPVGFAFSQ
jgi:hypothetical protein